ncbi:MAG: hypothetical protein JST68_25035 [Bacteroidetes bacterium]|nr:hypothetical protein [Bacteroidota bacterium]
MKKMSTSMAIAIAIITLPSCKKFIDPHPNDPNEIGKYCRLSTLAVDTDDPNRIVNITYNAAGDPISMKTPVPVYQLQFDDIYFKYDNHGRLIDYSIFFPGVSYPDFEHKYSYPDHQTIIDSFFNSEYTTVYQVTRHTLDEKGRIIKSFIKYFPVPSEGTIIVKYDNRGNKILPGVVYDDKINIYRISKTFQLAYQDFSMNNPIAPALNGYPASILSYNEAGLPLHYQAEPSLPSIHLFFYTFFDLKATYDCSDSSSGQHYLK